MRPDKERFAKLSERRNQFASDPSSQSHTSDICGSFSFDCCSPRPLFLFYSAFSSLGRIVRHETKFPARESDEEWEVEIERDRWKGSRNRGTSYMISLESLKWSISGNARSYASARPLARGAVSRWQSCPIMRALWDSWTRRIPASGKSGALARQGGRLRLSVAKVRRRVAYFLVRRLNFYRVTTITECVWNPRSQSLNAVNVSLIMLPEIN